MADWSQMPEDLLRLIARRLGTQFDILRFRSVCSSWRSSVAPSLDPFRCGRFPITPDDRNPGHCTRVDFLRKRTIFLLGVPRSCGRSVPSGWLLKVAEDVPWGMNTLNPLSICSSAPLPEDFPRVLDLMNQRVVELGHEYVLQDTHYHGYSDNYDIMYTIKVAFLCLHNENDFALLRTVAYGMLAMFKSREKRRFPIPDMPSPYDDMISFKGEFYAIDNAGRTVVVGLE